MIYIFGLAILKLLRYLIKKVMFYYCRMKKTYRENGTWKSFEKIFNVSINEQNGMNLVSIKNLWYLLFHNIESKSALKNS